MTVIILRLGDSNAGASSHAPALSCVRTTSPGLTCHRPDAFAICIMRETFWTLPLEKLTSDEWEALCDGCGKCCLNKLEFEDNNELAFTRVACKLLNSDTCQCKSYLDRHDYVPECVVLSPDRLKEIAYWLPTTCAYRLRYERRALYKWHYLISGDRDSVHRAGVSVRGWTVSEAEIPEEDWEDYIIEDLS